MLGFDSIICPGFVPFNDSGWVRFQTYCLQKKKHYIYLCLKVGMQWNPPHAHLPQYLTWVFKKSENWIALDLTDWFEVGGVGRSRKLLGKYFLKIIPCNFHFLVLTYRCDWPRAPRHSTTIQKLWESLDSSTDIKFKIWNVCMILIQT